MFMVVATPCNTALGPGKYLNTTFVKELKEGRQHETGGNPFLQQVYSSIEKKCVSLQIVIFGT